MNRTQVVIVATLLALVGVVGPLALTFFLSWTLAVDAEKAHLEILTQRALERSVITFAGAAGALHKFEHLTVKPCSDEHIKLMRLITVTTQTIEDIGYIEDGFLKCTAGGPNPNPIKKYPVDFTFPDGIQASVGVAPEFGGDSNMTSLFYKSHMVLIAPGRFTDIMIEPDVNLAVLTTSGKLLGTLHNPDKKMVDSIARTGKGVQKGGDIFAVLRIPGLVAIAIEPRSNIAAQLRREQMVLLPFGFLTACLIVAAVILFSRKRLSPLGELKIGIERREFVVHYQPIMELKSGLCIGAEALVRWRRPKGYLMYPDLFIPLAEESGLILPITDQVVEAVVHDMEKVLIADRRLHISINFSAQDIKTGRILTVLGRALRDTEIQPHQIWVEATERGFMDIKAARATITQARKMGYTVAIDDFGTGYSSLAYLQGFPLDALKIDKSFIDTIGTDSPTSSVTPHIIDLAKTLDLKIVAEGIETQAQADYLLMLKVDYGQGWLFAKALPAPTFLDFYRKNSAESG